MTLTLYYTISNDIEISDEAFKTAEKLGKIYDDTFWEEQVSCEPWYKALKECGSANLTGVYNKYADGDDYIIWED